MAGIPHVREIMNGGWNDVTKIRILSLHKRDLRNQVLKGWVLQRFLYTSIIACIHNTHTPGIDLPQKNAIVNKKKEH